MSWPICILVGDVRERLRGLPADHFDCVVTSPPYWGLRDYGTASWVGGDAACSHRSPTMREDRSEARAKLAGSVATNSAQLLLAHRSACGLCGAVKVDRQIGLEPTLGEHIEVMVDVCREIRRVLKPTGTFWLNYGDCYATSPNGRSAADTKALSDDDRTFRDKPFSTVGPIYEQQPNSRQEARRGRSGNLGNGGENGVVIPSGRVVAGGFLKPKDLCMVPNRIAIALQEDGWWVRSEIVWGKTNPMPESIGDRPATAHEKIFMLTRSERYAYDAVAVRQTGAPDTVDRYHRGRSDHHKWFDGGPGDQSIAKSFEAMAAKHPKAPADKKAAPRAPTPAGWDTGEGTHGKIHKGRTATKAPKKPRSPRQTALAESAGASSSSRRMSGFNERWEEGKGGRNSFARQTKDSAGAHGQKPQFRTDRDPVEYSGSRNLRNYEPASPDVWEISTAPFGGEFCTHCESYFQGAALRRLRVEEVDVDGKRVTRRFCACGSCDGWLSHFATFPPDLAARCLQTVPRFCCANCGAPRERVVETELVPTPKAVRKAVVDGRDARADRRDQGSNRQKDGHLPGYALSHTTLGWSSTCKCEAPDAPPHVLDPFGGAGTTALVAWRMQMPCTVIELNMAYAKLACERLKADQGMWSDVTIDAGAPAEKVA